MKKVFTLLLASLALTAAMTGCDNDQEPPHEHSFSSTWIYDENQHWHAAECEHTDLELDRGDHVDSDNNDLCDICGYIADHTHTFEEGWTWDESTHWHAAACKHNTKDGEAKHADENNDAICDVCTYDYGHTHTYDEAWVSVGENGHWHAPTCGHSVDGSQLTAHTDENNDGNCDVCGENGGHEHTYAEEWTTTEDEHWRDVTCGHDVPAADKGVHADTTGDGTCDICGYTPPHFHTFADTLSSDKTNHWYASTCGHDVKKDEAPHSGHDEDGVCDVCAHVVFRLFTVNVSVPEYIKVFAPDGTEAKSFVVKEKTPVSFTLLVPTYAEIVEIRGAKQNGKPTPDGEYNVYTVSLEGIADNAAVTVIGNKLSVVEMIVSDGKGVLNIEGTFKYAFEDITFEAPSAGRYMIFSTSDEDVQFGVGEMGEDGYPIYTKVYFMDVEAPGSVSLQSRYFPWSVPEGGQMSYTYVVTKVDSEITLGSLRAEGYTLPTNVTVTVRFTAPKAGRYQISSSTLGMIWNEYVCDSIVLTATEDNQEMSFTVRYENSSVPSFNFDCNIVSMEATPMQEGSNTVTAPYGSYLAIKVTAAQAGSYSIQAQSPYVSFYQWNESTSTMHGLGNTYTQENMKKGDSFVLYVTVNIYEYDGTDDITDTLTVSCLGYIPPLSGDAYLAQVGTNNGYISNDEASDFVFSVEDGDQISFDGGKTWHTSVEVNLPAFGSISYQVKSATGSDTVRVTVERITYAFDLTVGTQIQNMVPGKEYTVTLSGSVDPAYYVNYILSWANKDVVASYNGQVIQSGATISSYAQGYALILVNNGAEAANVEFTLKDPYVSGGSTGENNLSLGENAVNVTVENYYCAGTTVTFTAPAKGTYTLSAAPGEENADVSFFTENASESVSLPYTFSLEKGETVRFLVATTAFMTLETDVIDLYLERSFVGEDLTNTLSGTYNVNFIMDGLYTLTFQEGRLRVVDRSSGDATGEYIYNYNAADGISVTNIDGSACDIEISIDAQGNMTFRCKGLLQAQSLVKA